MRAWVEVARVEARPLRQAAFALNSARVTPPTVGISGPESTPPMMAASPAAASPQKLDEDDTVPGPVRATGFIFGGALRVMVPIGALGVGAVVEASVTWHAELPFAVRARVWPLAGITNNTSQFSAPGGAGTGSASLDAMFDGRYFAAGLGVGFGTYPYFQNSFSRESIAFALTQLVRIGALDGLNFGAQTQLVATPVGFNLYGGEAMLQVPIRRKWLLQFRGGGLAAPFAFGDIGMRIGLGDAEKSRLFLTPTVGVAYVGGLAGPSVGLGFEYRP